MSLPRSALSVLLALATTPAAAQPPEALRGAPLDVRGFRYSRTIPEGPDGLVSLALDAAVLAHSKGPDYGFEDVRIADAGGRQVPYLLQQREEPAIVPLTLRPPGAIRGGAAAQAEPGHHRSTYRVALPYARLPLPRLRLETSDRVFRRVVRLAVEREPDRLHREPWLDVGAGAVWQHASADEPAPAVMLPIPHDAGVDLLVLVDEGDNRPLTLTAASLLLPSWTIRFYRPAEPLTLLYGHDGMRAPRYDLALLAPQVLDAPAREIDASPEQSVEPRAEARLLTVNAFWIGLAAAVVVLLALIVKLVAGSSESPSPPPPPVP